VAAKQVLEIKVLNCGGLRDLMSELESSFLVSCLGLFRNQQDFGKGMPRANVNLVRAYDAKGFYRAAFGNSDVLHLIAHANGTQLDVGVAKKRVEAARLGREAVRAKLKLPPVVVSTGCQVQSTAWQAGMKAAGAQILIASSDVVTPASLTAFDMAFYSALLARVRKKNTLNERVKASFKLASTHYKAVHAAGTPKARFTLVEL
jgi:hypothetical protein